MVAVFLAEHAAAVLLHIKAKFSGPLIPCPEIGPEIPVEKFHAVLPGVFLRRGLDAVVILIETGQQGGGKGPIAVLRRIPGRFLQPVLITVGTASWWGCFIGTLCPCSRWWRWAPSRS